MSAREEARLTDPDPVCAEAKCLDDVRPPSDASIEVDLALGVLDDLGVELVQLEQRVQRRWGAVTRTRDVSELGTKTCAGSKT